VDTASFEPTFLIVFVKTGFSPRALFLTAYTVDACALTSRLPSLSLIDLIYGRHKSDVGVGSGHRRRF